MNLLALTETKSVVFSSDDFSLVINCQEQVGKFEAIVIEHMHDYFSTTVYHAKLSGLD